VAADRSCRSRAVPPPLHRHGSATRWWRRDNELGDDGRVARGRQNARVNAEDTSRANSHAAAARQCGDRTEKAIPTLLCEKGSVPPFFAKKVYDPFSRHRRRAAIIVPHRRHEYYTCVRQGRPRHADSDPRAGDRTPFSAKRGQRPLFRCAISSRPDVWSLIVPDRSVFARCRAAWACRLGARSASRPDVRARRAPQACPTSISDLQGTWDFPQRRLASSGRSSFRGREFHDADEGLRVTSASRRHSRRGRPPPDDARSVRGAVGPSRVVARLRKKVVRRRATSLTPSIRRTARSRRRRPKRSTNRSRPRRAAAARTGGLIPYPNRTEASSERAEPLGPCRRQSAAPGAYNNNLQICADAAIHLPHYGE